MDADTYSLNNLRDIVIPDAPAIWPPAPGVWVAIIVVVSVVLFLVLRWRAVRERNAYRRAGLELLAEARSVYDVSVVLKRVALVAYSREQVASLYGKAWAAYLDNTCSRCRFIKYVEGDISSQADHKLLKMARRWIHGHRVPRRVQTG
jgi:hypothetical protein